MKTAILCALGLLGGLPASLAQTNVGAYFCFQSSPSDTNNYSEAVNASMFPGLPSPVFTRTGSTLSTFNNFGLSFTAFDGSAWVPGKCATWSAASAANTGISWQVTLNTTSVTGLVARFKYRLYGVMSGGALVTNLAAFEYQIGSGAFQAVPGASLTLTNDSNFNNIWAANLAGLTNLENQSVVTLRWRLPDLDQVSGTQVRMDDLQIAGVRAASQPKPNIVFILADDLGWADLSGGQTAYGGGSDFYETPNLSRLADEGICFTSAYVCQNCVPTRAALLSGQYPTRSGIYNVGTLNRNVKGVTPLIGPNDNEDVPAALWTMAEMLKDAGYITAHVGKYNVGGHEGGAATLPLNQGFDFNYGGSAAASPGDYWATNVAGVWQFNPNVDSSLYGYAQPYDAAYRSRYRTWAEPRYTLPSSLVGTTKHVGDAVVDASLDFMESHRTNGVPFYLQFHEYLVHEPTESRPDLQAKYDQKKLTQPSHLGHNNTTYAGMVEQFDQSVGRLLAYLTDPNGDGNPSDSIASNTLVILYSDNGGWLGNTVNPPLRGGKGMFTEGGLRVPLVAWMPGAFPHRTNDSLVQMVDFYPTLAEFAGGTLPNPVTQPLDGFSLAALFKGQTNASSRSANYWHFPGYLDTRSRPCSTIIKNLAGRRYKLHYYYEDQRYELYCLTDDIGETNDLLKTVAEQAAIWPVATNLSADLRQWLDNTGSIYPTNRATVTLVPPPTPLAGPPPRSEQTVVNVQLLNSADVGTGPAAYNLWGIMGCDQPIWNIYTETNAQSVKAGLVDEHGLAVPATFISRAPALLAYGPNAGNAAFTKGGTADDFFYTCQFLSGGGTPGVAATNSFAIGGLIPGNEYDLVFYANWNPTNAGSRFTIGGVTKTADGVPNGSNPGFAEGHSYVQFKRVRPGTDGLVDVTWATYAPPNGAHRGPLNAVQVRGDFRHSFTNVFILDEFSRSTSQNRLTLNWQSRSAHTYALSCSSDLHVWSVISNNIPSGGLTTTLSLPLSAACGGDHSFFKVREE